MNRDKSKKSGLKYTIRDIIFRHDTPSSKAFDVVLLVLIVISIILVMLESVEEIRRNHHTLLWTLEWIITIIFTIEYILRIYTTPRKWDYIKSFYGIIDLISIIPTYLTLFAFSSQYLATVRAVRLLRVFRIFKLSLYLGEVKILTTALRASRPKITVFLTAVLTSAVIIGSIMYMVESYEGTRFTSIPRSIYWAIVTLTTVGYGDISPVTTLGQTLAAIVMILGYGIIAVPTGIVSAELASAQSDFDLEKLQSCALCDAEDLPPDANFCMHCGTEL